MQKILGVDFDDTLFCGGYPGSEKPNYPVIEHVKRRQREGWYVILVTCRHTQHDLDDALEKCAGVGIRIDAVNENHPALIERFGDCRKIYCDEYIDDRNLSLREIEKAYYRNRR